MARRASASRFVHRNQQFGTGAKALVPFQSTFSSLPPSLSSISLRRLSKGLQHRIMEYDTRNCSQNTLLSNKEAVGLVDAMLSCFFTIGAGDMTYLGGQVVARPTNIGTHGNDMAPTSEFYFPLVPESVDLTNTRNTMHPHLYFKLYFTGSLPKASCMLLQGGTSTSSPWVGDYGKFSKWNWTDVTGPHTYSPSMV
ncbi:hypothetical protein T439DRAFT_224031 [Meredithblackwellia eburnea MCA 4105]